MPDTVNELSERELEILKLVATGASNKEIAQQLVISTNTVKVHLRNIFAKVGVASRTEAALFAVREGLVAGEALVTPALEVEQPESMASPVEAAALQASPQSPRLPWLAAVSLLVLLSLALVTVILFRQTAAVSGTPESATPTAGPRWRAMAALPTARRGIAVAAYENQIYAIAGQSGQQVTGLVESYDPRSNTWIERTPKPLPVSDVNAVVIGGLIYVPGGRLASGEVTDTLEVYDPRQDSWESRASLPLAVSAYALAAFEGKLYLFGGKIGERYLDSVFEYDPERDEWTTRTSMPTRRAYAGAVDAGGRIFVLGGFDGTRSLSANEIYLPEREGTTGQPWSAGSPLPEGRYGMGISSVAEIIHLIGGIGEEDGPVDMLAYFSQVDQWQAIATPGMDLGTDLRAVSLGVDLYALGGEKASAPSGQNLVYQVIYTISIPVIIK
ncbi:MAG: hypothetical protein EHM70_11885 [Chloroflexota bacterium]|nr:MAG: hypothetical protein EHM70_11885 [Chloroflexota bacterium]